MKLCIPSIALCLVPSLIYGFTSQPPLKVRAKVTCTDGTVEELNDVRINGSTDIVAYIKPEKVKATNETEVVLGVNPRDNSISLQLGPVKTIIFKNHRTSYVYQDPNKTTQDIFKEVEIDGKTRLIANNWKLQGLDAESNLRRIDLAIVEKIEVTETYNKEEACKPCPATSSSSAPAAK